MWRMRRRPVAGGEKTYLGRGGVTLSGDAECASGDGSEAEHGDLVVQLVVWVG